MVARRQHDNVSVHVNNTETPRSRLLDLWGINDDSFEILASTLPRSS